MVKLNKKQKKDAKLFLDDVMSDIDKAIDTGLDRLALVGLLCIPAWCVTLDKGKDKGEYYKNWCDTHLFGRKGMVSFNKQLLSGEQIYKLRCHVIHQAYMVINVRSENAHLDADAVKSASIEVGNDPTCITIDGFIPNYLNIRDLYNYMQCAIKHWHTHNTRNNRQKKKSRKQCIITLHIEYDGEGDKYEPADIIDHINESVDNVCIHAIVHSTVADKRMNKNAYKSVELAYDKHKKGLPDTI